MREPGGLDRRTAGLTRDHLCSGPARRRDGRWLWERHLADSATGGDAVGLRRRSGRHDSGDRGRLLVQKTRSGRGHDGLASTLFTESGGSGRRFVSDGEGNRDRPVHGSGTLYPIASEAEQAVVAFAAALQQVATVGDGEPMTEMEHPQRRDRHGHHEGVDTGLSIDLGRFEVEAVAFPVSKTRLDPEPFTTAAPGVPVGGQVESPVARRGVVVSPVGDDVHWTERPVLREVDVLVVETLAGQDAEVGQGHCLTVGGADAHVGLHAHMPVPAVGAAVLLEVDPAELGIAEERHRPPGREQGRDPIQEGDVRGGAGAAEGQDVPDKRQETLAVGHAQVQDAHPVAQVGAIHHQGYLGRRPVPEQLHHQRSVDPIPPGRMIEHPAQTLDQAVALPGQGQRQGQRAQPAVGRDRQGGAQQGEIRQLWLGGGYAGVHQGVHDPARQVYTVHETLLSVCGKASSPSPYHTWGVSSYRLPLPASLSRRYPLMPGSESARQVRKPSAEK